MRTLTIILVVFFITSASYSATIDVPADQPTIQAGIDAAWDYDTVLVDSGTYTENIDFIGKRIVVTSELGPGSTILQPSAPGSPTVRITSGETSGTTLSGFTVRNGGNVSTVEISSSSSPIIENCIFHDNIYDIIGAEVIDCVSSSVMVKRCLFYNNMGISCIGVYSGNVTIINNTFDSNARGFFCAEGGNATAINNIITNSTQYGVHGSFVISEYNDVWNNSPNYQDGALPGTGDISVDPLYDNPSLENYKLTFNSPCIDAGNPDPYYNDPNGTRNDMGVYPFLTSPYPMNINFGDSYNDHVAQSLTPIIYWSYYTDNGSLQNSYEVEIGTDDDWTVACLVSSKSGQELVYS